MIQSRFPHERFKAWQVAVRPGKWVIRDGDEVGEVEGPCLSRPLVATETDAIQVGEDGDLSIHGCRFPPGSWFMAWVAIFEPNGDELERTLIVPGREVEPPMKMLVSRKCVTPLGMCDFDQTWKDWESHINPPEPERLPFSARVATATPVKPILE
jgi:hypothetical protein